VAGSGQAIRADAAVFPGLVGGLAKRSQADNGQAGADLGGMDHLAAFQADDHRGITDHGPDQVPDIGSLAAGHFNRHALRGQGINDLVITGDNRRQSRRIDAVGIAADRIGDLEIVNGSNTEQVIGIHDQGVLGDPAIPGWIACFPGHQVGHGRFRPGPVSMDGTAIIRITRQVRDDLAE